MLQELIELLNDSKVSIRIGAAEAIALIAHVDGKAVEPAIPKLIELLGDDNEYVRNWTAGALYDIGRLTGTGSIRPAIPRLIELLDSKSAEIRFDACKELGPVVQASYRYRQLHKVLWDLITGSKRRQTDSELVELMKPAIPKLIELLDDPGVSIEALESLTQIASMDSEAVKSVEKAVSDKKLLRELMLLPDDRHALALAHIAAPTTAIPILIELLDDSEAKVRGKAALALSMIELYVYREKVKPDGWPWESRVQISTDLINPAIPKLVELLRDNDANVRINALVALGQIADVDAGSIKPAIPRLIELLDNKPEDGRLRACIILGTIAGKQAELVEPAIPRLTELLKDSDAKISSEAKRVLEKVARGKN